MKKILTASILAILLAIGTVAAQQVNVTKTIINKGNPAHLYLVQIQNEFAPGGLLQYVSGDLTGIYPNALEGLINVTTSPYRDLLSRIDVENSVSGIFEYESSGNIDAAYIDQHSALDWTDPVSIAHNPTLAPGYSELITSTSNPDAIDEESLDEIADMYETVEDTVKADFILSQLTETEYRFIDGVVTSVTNVYLELYAVHLHCLSVTKQTGDFGDLQWEIDNGTLTISGTGAMPDYEWNSVPWYSLCSSIETVIIEDGVTSIGNNAFFGCINLISVTIPESVTSIGELAFYGCRNLISVTIPNGVPSIGERAFYGCDALTSVTIPNSVTGIGNQAFAYCSSLASVTIPNSVTSIEVAAFAYCSSLKNITVGWSVPLPINADVFSEVTTAEINLHVPAEKEDLYRDDAVWGTFNIVAQPPVGQTWNLTPTMTATLLSGVITVNTALEAEAMPDYNWNIPWDSYRSSITTVIIEDGVTRIGNQAFYGCSNLASVTVPASVTSIGDEAFGYCSSLASVTVPNSVTSIGEYAFVYSSLESVTIPNSVTSIGSLAFGNCSSLESVTVGNSVTGIGELAFYSCSSLNVINVDENNTAYTSEDGILFNKAKTTLIQYPVGKTDAGYTIPNSVTTIGDDAFAFCSNLASVTIPAGVTGIGDEAFGWCSSLVSVTNLNPTPQATDRSVFELINLSEATLYVPAESVAAYGDAPVWQDFGTITAYIPDAIKVPAANAVRAYFEPATGSLRIEGLAAPTPVIITDLNGRTVFQQTISGNEPIAAGYLPQGVYLVNVNGQTVKIIKH